MILFFAPLSWETFIYGFSLALYWGKKKRGAFNFLFIFFLIAYGYWFYGGPFFPWKTGLFFYLNVIFANLFFSQVFKGRGYILSEKNNRGIFFIKNFDPG